MAGSGYLDGRTIVVTGAARGLGRAYAVAIAAAGGRLVVNDHDSVGLEQTVEQIRAIGAEVHAHVAHLGSRESAALLVATAVERYGTLDGLVANAGVLNPGSSWHQGAGTVDDTLETNIAAVWHSCVAAMDAMRPAARGSIVTIVSGAMQGLHGLALYGTSKAAVLGMTYGLALELEGSGVRLNAVSPLANTPMSDQMEIAEEYKGGPPEGIAPVVVYLLSDRSASVHGQVVRFDGARLGLVAGPHLAVTSTERAGWTVDDIAVALEGPLGAAMAPVGLAAAPPPRVV